MEASQVAFRDCRKYVYIHCIDCCVGDSYVHKCNGGSSNIFLSSKDLQVRRKNILYCNITMHGRLTIMYYTNYRDCYVHTFNNGDCVKKYQYIKINYVTLLFIYWLLSITLKKIIADHENRCNLIIYKYK